MSGCWIELPIMKNCSNENHAQLRSCNFKTLWHNQFIQYRIFLFKTELLDSPYFLSEHSHKHIQFVVSKIFANINARIRSHFHTYFGKCKMFLEGPKMMFIYAYNLNFNYLRIEALSN